MLILHTFPFDNQDCTKIQEERVRRIPIIGVGGGGGGAEGEGEVLVWESPTLMGSSEFPIGAWGASFVISLLVVVLLQMLLTDTCALD